MAFTIQKIIDLKGILFLMLLTIPSQAATLDCYGKAFHCVNSTHFMICVDLGGVSTTIDDVIIPCPSPTVCRRTNRFECEFPAPSTLEPEVSTITNIQTTESEAITFTPLVTTAIPFEEYLNTLSTSTLSESELRSSTTESSSTIDPITVGLDSRNVSATENVVTDSIATDAYMNPESLSASPAISVRPNDANESNPENNVTLIPSVILNSTTSVNNIQQLTTTEQTRVTDFPVLNTKNSERNSKTSVTSIDITSVVNEQSVITEENFDKAFQEATMNVTAIDYSRAINNQTVTTEPISTNDFLKLSNNATLTVIANNATERPLSTTIKMVKDDLEVSTKVTVTSDTTAAATNQTSITTELLNGFLQPIINATSTVNISAVTEKVVTTDEVHTEYFQEPSIKIIVTNITKDVNDQILTTKEVLINNFLQPSINETTTIITNAVTEEKVKTEQDFWEPSINITSNDITTASKNQTLHTLKVLANDLQSSNNITLNVIPSVVTDQPVTTVTDKFFTTDFQEPSINETRKVTTSAIDDQTVTIEQTDSIKTTSNTSASAVTEQTIKTEEIFTKINREPSINITTSDIKSATNNQTLNTVEVLANDLKSSMNLTLTVIPSTVSDQTVTTVADKFLTTDFQEPSTNETGKVTTSAINDQTVGSEPNNFIKTTTSITSTNAVTQTTIKTEEIFINNFPEPSINTIVTSITNATNTQTTATSNSFKNDFLRPSIDPTLMITTSAVTKQISSINNNLVPSEKAAHPANLTIKSEFTTVKSIQQDIKNVSVLENKNKPITETKNNLETTTNTVLTNNNQLNIHASESLIFKTNDSNLMQIISNDIGTTEASTVTVLNNTYNEVSVFTAIPEPVATDNPLNDGKNIVVASKPESNLLSDTTTSLTDSSVTTESQPNIYSSEIRANDFNDLNVENKPNDTITPEKVKPFIINENNKESLYFNITVAEPEIERLASITGNITSIKIAPADINTETTTGATLNTDIVTPENLIYDILRPIAVLNFDNAPKIATTINKLETLTNLSSTTLPNTTTLISTNRTTANITNNLDSVSITLTDIVLPNSREVKTAVKRYNLNSNNKSETVLNASGLVQTNEFLASILDPSLVEQITTVEVSVDDKKVIEENIDSIKKSENTQTNKSAASQPLSIMDQVNDGINAARTDDGKNEKTVTTNIPSTKVNSANGRMSTSKEYTNEAIALNQNKLFFRMFEKTTSNPLSASMDSNQISPSEQIQSHTQTDIFQKDTFTVSPSTKIRDSEGFHSQPELILTEKTDSFPKTTTHSLITKISIQPVSSDKTKISEGKHLPPSFRDGIIPDDNGQDLISLPTTASVKIGNVTTINVSEEKGVLEDKTHNNTEKNIFFITNTEDKQDTYAIEAVVPSQKNEINSRVLEDIGESTERRFLIESTTVSPILNTDPIIVIAENPSTPFAVTNEGQPEISFSITDRHYDSTITETKTNAQPSDNFNKNYFLPPHSEAPFTMETVVKKIHSSTLSPVLRPTVPDIYLATTEGIKHSDVSPVFLDSLSFPYSKVLTKTENTPLNASTTNPVVNYSAKDTIKQVSATEGNSEKESNVLQNIVPITTPKLEAINQDIVAPTVKVAVTAGINTTVAKPGNITTLEENTTSITTNPDLDLQSRLTKGLSEIIPTEINNLQVDLTTQPLVSAAEILRKTTFIANDERKTTPILALLGKNKTSKILNPEVQSMISNLYLEKKSNTLSTANIMSNQEDIMGTVTTSKIDLLQEPRGTTTKSTPSNSIESVTYFMQTTTPISKLDQKQNSLSFSVSSNIASQLMTKTKVNEAPQTIRVTAQASSKSLEYDTQGKYISSNTTPLLDNNTVKRSNGNLSIKSQESEVLNLTVTKQFLGVGDIPPIDFVAYAKKMDTMAPEDFHRSDVGNKVKTQTIEIDDQLILVTESSRSLFDRKQEPQGLKDYKAELDVATVVNTEKYYTVIPSPSIGLPNEIWKKETQTDVNIDKPDKRSINMYSEKLSTTQSLSVRNKSTQQNLKQASSQTTLSISLPDLDFAIEDTTGSDVFVDKNIESEKTHSGIISFLVPPKQRGIKEKIEKTEKKENETDERPESSIHTEKKLTSFLATYVHTASPDISSKSLTKDINNNVRKDVENKEKILIQTENNNFESTRLNQVPSSKKINTENNSDYSTHTFSRENKKRTTNNTNGNSTVSRNETHSLNSKSIDQNNASLHAHNMTVISNHQSSTPQNMSEINTTATNNGQTVGYQTLESTTRKPKSNIFSCTRKKRGRYADEQDCKKFYVCIGNSHVVVGTCPVNTVFSEIRKQCTKNLSHCIRNNEFRCVAEGRFSDFLNENVYYICVKNNIKAFVRFKLMCQKGYHLNKTSVRCVLNKESQQSTSKSETSKNNSEQSGSLTKQEEPEENSEKTQKKFKCKKEGIFADPSNCKRYFECTKIDKVVYRQKRKKCDSGEIFHRDKKKCVDSDSYETYEC